MKLREEEFYEQYHQHGGTTIIPTEIFNELYDDATEEIERLNKALDTATEIINNKHKEIVILNNIINEISKDLQQVVIWCAENKHNENTIERYLVVDYGTIVRKINEIRTKLDKENNNDTK